MGNYHLKTHMFAIEMGGYDMVLKEKWLCTFGPITVDFNDLYRSFTKQGKKHTLKGLTSGPLKISLFIVWRSY